MSENAVVSHPTDRRPLSIKGLVPTLPERGKVKIGVKGKTITSGRGKEFQPPMKLDHFRLTTLQRGQDDNFIRDEDAHRVLGEKPTEIPIRLLYDDTALNFQSSYGCFIGTKMWCRGDGQTAMRLKSLDAKEKERVPVACPCPRKEPDYEGNDKCKMNGLLSFLIDGVDGVGGVWKFRTTSYNTTVGITSSLQFLRANTGGVLANIPLKLCVRPKNATTPNGQPQTIYVVSVEFRGTVNQLRDIGHQVALQRAQTHLRIEQIEDEARRMLPAPVDVPLPGDDAREVVEEFYPEQAGALEVVEGEVVPPKPTKETIAAEIQQSQAQTDKQGDEPDPLEVVNSQGEIILSTAVEKDWAAMLEHIMGLATKAGDEAALNTIIENNSKTLEALVDATIRAGIQDSISYFGHEVVLNGSKLQARRVGR